ncbi:DUF1428 family protein [Sediminibacillus albus]|uniref:Uncharacterized protein n=1 Tax=Sediminibacillus albus TaxID=407036 RepID=A0A1G9B8N3_9BACI|nr:DUF1428 family protein [Sediminibacillus albus]SDK35380.1 Protein of unknown function [Sediminibacillus albus]
MFTVLSFYRVKKQNTDKFLSLNKLAGEINMSYGAINHDVYLLFNRDAVNGLTEALQLGKDEDLLFGQIVFRNKSHYEEVTAQLNEDEQIQLLSKQVSELIDTSNILSASFISDR